MNDGGMSEHHLRPVGAPPDWRRSRSESSGAVDDMETSYVPAATCLPGPHRRHYVNIPIPLYTMSQFSLDRAIPNDEYNKSSNLTCALVYICIR